MIEESSLLCFYWTASSVWLSVLVLGCSRCSSPQWHILDSTPPWVGLGDVANGLHPINTAALSVCDRSSHKFCHLLILSHWTMIVFSKYSENRHVCFSLSLSAVTAENGWVNAEEGVIRMWIKARDYKDISFTWHDRQTADSQYTYPNLVSLSLFFSLYISIFSTHQVAMAVAPHAHKELAAPMHSWHLYDAEGAVDIFTTGAFMSPCLWGWGEAQWKAESGLGCREEEGEMSKFRRSQLPEEHIAPGRKITVSCSVPSLAPSVLAAVLPSSAPSW